MNGKWIATVLAVSCSLGGCKKTPTASNPSAVAPPIVLASKDSSATDIPTIITRLVAAYEWEPNAERAAAMWSGLERLDEKLRELRSTVAREAGGRRAEAEIERIELQRLRESTMARITSTQNRLKTTRSSNDTLTASIDGEGIRAAAAAIGQRMQREGRFRPWELAPHFSGRQVPMP
jgi:acyl-CoA reductase-like NAD-dependent aldehyde dehydrogenase